MDRLQTPGLALRSFCLAPPDLLRPPVNSVRLLLHPDGLGPRIVNFAAWRAHTLHVLRQQLEVRADPVIRGLLSEVANYPVPAGSEASNGVEVSQRFATPLQIATRFGTVSFLSTVTVFGTASDVTLSELALEMLFPADAETVQIVSELA